MRTLVQMVVAVAVSVALRIDAHTPEETNGVVRTMLEIVATSSDDSFESLSRPWRVVRWSDKEKFFGIGIGGWTRDEKEAAFLSYLGQLGSRDFGEHTTPFYTGDGDARMAVWVCENASYTNAVPSLMGLITNRTCSVNLRCTAIRAYAKLCSVDDKATHFVETVTTNHFAYSLRERGLLRGHYADKIMSLASSSGERRMIYDRAVKMFYRHRMEDVGGRLCWTYCLVLRLKVIRLAQTASRSPGLCLLRRIAIISSAVISRPLPTNFFQLVSRFSN